MIFLGGVDEGMSYGGIFRYEVPIVVREAKEGADFLQFGQGRPSCDSIKLDGVHGDFVRSDDHPKVFNLGDCKLAF